MVLEYPNTILLEDIFWGTDGDAQRACVNVQKKMFNC